MRRKPLQSVEVRLLRSRLLKLAQKHPAAVLSAIVLRQSGRSAYASAKRPDSAMHRV